MARTIAIVGLVAVAILIGGVFWLTSGASQEEQFAQCRAGQIAGGSAAIGGPFELVSETNETVTDAQVIDQPTLIYFGYTFCPDVCSIDVSRNAVAVDILEEDFGSIVKPVFISIDPKRDTPEVLADYTEIMHPRMLGLTGSDQQVKAASQAYRTFYKTHDKDDDEFYLVDHSTLSYFVLPETGFAEFFRRDETPEKMAERIQCFLEAV
ncbi:MAG: SCO family protein [Pseudomonadota bacterium]